MRIKAFQGVVSFRRNISTLGGPFLATDNDGDPGQTSASIEVDHAVPAGYVSLKSKEVRITAEDFTVHTAGDLWKIGWVNIIYASARHYTYADGRIVSETISVLPTWDGGADDIAPFYFGQWFSTDEGDDGDAGCVGVLGDDPEHIYFNDGPCLPPSYQCYRHGKLDLGKFNASPAGYVPNYISNIDGVDRYAACLTAINNIGAIRTLWCVPWDVTYTATVDRAHDGTPTVTLDNAARTRLNIAAASDHETIINNVRFQSGGELLKQYSENRPVALIRERGRRMSF